MSQQTKETKARKARHFIKEWRKHRRMTQESLAEKAGMTAGAISQMENGIINYTQPSLEAIADALGTSAGALLSGAPQPSETAISGEEQIKQFLRRVHNLPEGAVHPLYRTIMGYVEDAERSEEIPALARSESANRPHTQERSGKRVPQSSS